MQGVKYSEALLAVRGSGLNAFLIRKPFTRKTALRTAFPSGGGIEEFWDASSELLFGWYLCCLGGDWCGVSDSRGNVPVVASAATEGRGLGEAGRVTQLELDTPTEVVFRKNRVDGWRVTSEKAVALVVKQSDQDIVAFSPRCPHLGCAVDWVARQHEFLCPCHASTFSIEGDVLSGPAPRSLIGLRQSGRRQTLARTYQSVGGGIFLNVLLARSTCVKVEGSSYCAS